MLPEGIRAYVKKDSYEIPPIFGMLQKDGSIEEHVMYNTYNMGIGMIVGVAPEQADEAVRLLNACGEKAMIIGDVKEGEKGIELC